MKMIVSSFYNTLIDEEGAIPTSTMFTLDEYKKNGSLFTVLTNRDIDEVLYYDESFPFIDYIISFNGSIIYDVNRRVVLRKKELDDNTISKVEELLSDYEILYYTEDGVFENRVDSVLKIEVKLPKKNKKIIDICKDNGINYSILKINKELYLEISPSTFKDALNSLLDNLKINTKEILGIIGNDSDIDLINYLDNCYVVSNASKELKSKTKKRTKSNTSKGVEYLLKKIKK